MIDPIHICFGCMSQISPFQTCPVCGHDNRVRSNSAGYLPGIILANRYFVGKILGHGGFGVTYVGCDLETGTKVAIKEYFPREIAVRNANSVTLHPRRESIDQFRRGCQRALDEALIIANMQAVPNVVRMYNAFAANGTVYMVMEFIPGITLKEWVQNGGRMTWQTAYAIMRPIINSFITIHSMNIIHRDISPDNIMFNTQTNQPVLLDFGAAHNYIGIQNHSYSMRPCYAPPEQYSSTAVQDVRTDEYALCATMYFLVTGNKPPESLQLLHGFTSMTAPRSTAPDIPPAFEQILLKGMSLKINERYDSMQVLLDKFDALFGKKKKPVWPLVTVMLLMVIVGGVLACSMLLSKGIISLPDSNLRPTVMSVFGNGDSAAPSVMPRTLKSDNMSDYVMGTSLQRSQITSITFSDMIAIAIIPSSAIDVSAAGDGSVMMWSTKNHNNMYDLHFASEGAIFLPADCSGLFAGYTNMTSLHFQLSIDTSCVKNMSHMFENCSKLYHLDVSCFNTSNVTDFSYMFSGCTRLTKIDASSFDTSGATDMNHMFFNIYHLNILDLRGFDTSCVSDMSYMFADCPSLTTIHTDRGFTLAPRRTNMFSGCGTTKLTYR